MGYVEAKLLANDWLERPPLHARFGSAHEGNMPWLHLGGTTLKRDSHVANIHRVL